MSAQPDRQPSPRASVSIANTRLGRYWIERELGAGGMGRVYAAFDPLLGRRAAVKVLRPELTSQPELEARFLAEARAAATIADPGIVQVFDFDKHVDGSTFIVMELLEGAPLDRRLRLEGVLPIHDALRIVRQVASTLGAAHARGIVHRNLTPANIFVARDPETPAGERIKILDFGIAKLVAGSSDSAEASEDVYALGCVLFTLITGAPPFDAPRSAAHGPAPLASSRRAGVSTEIDELIARCLAKDPNERYTCGTALAAAIDGLPRQRELHATGRSTRIVAGLLALAIIAVVAMAAVVATHDIAVDGPRSTVPVSVSPETVRR